MPCGQRLLALLWKDKTNKDFVILSDYLKNIQAESEFSVYKKCLKSKSLQLCKPIDIKYVYACCEPIYFGEHKSSSQ